MNSQEQALSQAKSIERTLKHLCQEIKTIEQVIDEQTQLSPELLAKYRKLIEVRGIGPTTARPLVTAAPYNHLLAAGKSKKLALIACMRSK